jgi:hypothetical protein
MRSAGQMVRPWYRTGAVPTIEEELETNVQLAVRMYSRQVASSPTFGRTAIRTRCSRP